MLICTPEGRLLDVVVGYVSPTEFTGKLQWAMDLGASLAKSHDPEGSVRKAHEEAGKKLDEAKEDPKDPFAKFGRMLDGKSHSYVAAHPLQPAGEFDPVAIVGNGQSFFGSSRGGTPKERLGTPPVLPEGFGEGSGK